MKQATNLLLPVGLSWPVDRATRCSFSFTPCQVKQVKITLKPNIGVFLKKVCKQLQRVIKKKLKCLGIIFN
jgi:hypothetical protein